MRGKWGIENILQNLDYNYDGFSKFASRIDNKHNLEGMKVFDYLYYRMLVQYSKQKWRSNPCSSASIFLCIIQVLLVYCIFMFLRPLFVSNAEDLKGIVLAISIAVVMLSLYLFNYHRYKNRDEEIKEKYKDCKANKWFKLWMFPLLILLLYFLPFIVMGHAEYL